MDFYTVADYVEGALANVKIIRMNKISRDREWNIFLVKIEAKNSGIKTE